MHTTFFEVVTGVREGCVLSPLLFDVALDFIMRKSMNGDETGIKWSRTHHLTDLDFAGDVAIIAENNGLLQQATTNLANEAKKSGLRLNPDKSKVMSIGRTNMNVDINVEASQLETVLKFTYLGSTVSRDGNVESEILTRIVKAASVFRKLGPIWILPLIASKIKLRLYHSIVVPIVAYASETWAMSMKCAKKLNAFHQRCLRRIMRVRYTDRVINWKS
ncbi:unnamed protein product [Heligmosomoides polygyrus]|uniref:Reverse transcriptase domain-containing protein n=1 Tax=Heligmosomoides polygyrus TaxID=6339 RepID=A0A183GML8_HELPZ|nr:unnamed protein product [Heligmosomoides polygyrus]